MSVNLTYDYQLAYLFALKHYYSQGKIYVILSNLDGDTHPELTDRNLTYEDVANSNLNVCVLPLDSHDLIEVSLKLTSSDEATHVYLSSTPDYYKLLNGELDNDECYNRTYRTGVYATGDNVLGLYLSKKLDLGYIPVDLVNTIIQGLGTSYTATTTNHYSGIITFKSVIFVYIPDGLLANELVANNSTELSNNLKGKKGFVLGNVIQPTSFGLDKFQKIAFELFIPVSIP